MDFHVDLYTEFHNRFVRRLLKWVPVFKGYWLVWAPVFSFFSKSSRTVSVEVSANKKTLFSTSFDLSNPPELNMVKKQRYDLGTALTIWSLLEPGDIFFDVGANFGYLTKIAAARVGERGTVVCIEPNPDAYKRATTSLPGNVLPFNRVAGANSSDWYRIDKPFYRQTTGSRFIKQPTGDLQSISVDEIYTHLGNQKVKLIKIDTEGSELFVLRGAQQLLKIQQPLVILEVVGLSEHFDYQSTAVYDFMRQFGYRYFYAISDDTNSIMALEKPQEGQILFSTVSLPMSILTL